MKKKLVRHKIPEIIKNSGRKPKFRIASNEEMPGFLISKFIEEINEFFSEPSAEEAADVLEVLRAFCFHYDISMHEVEKTANKKYKEKGSLYTGVILEGIEDD